VTQALAFAFWGSFYPVGLLFVLRYLAASRPLLLANLFLIGGAVSCLTLGALELVLLQVLPLDHRDNPAANGILGVLIGVAIILAVVLYLWRRPRPARTFEDTRPQEDPAPAKCFFTGMLIYSPGLGLIAAVKALSDAELSGAGLAVGLVVCVAVLLWMAEVPILATAVSPRRSAPALRRVGTFIARHGVIISALILVGLGVYLIVDGISTASTG
jgi:hypothetical protein